MRNAFMLPVTALLFATGCVTPPLDEAPDAAPETREAICERGASDFVTTKYCVSPPPVLRGLEDVQRLFELDSQQEGVSASVTTHSTSLVTRLVNPLNPRVILTRGTLTKSAVMTFTRGEQFVELVDRDPKTNELKFFLLSFDQECNARPTGCTNGELFSPKIESDWTRVRIDEDVDLHNTVVDCLQCHQPDGPGTEKILRMQEIKFPWTHFIPGRGQPLRSGADELAPAFLKLHGSERFAGFSATRLVENTLGFFLQLTIENDERDQLARTGIQPNEFVGATIEDEVAASAEGDSLTWRGIYANARAGRTIPVPYRKNNVADPNKGRVATLAYQAFMDGMPVDDATLNLGAVMHADVERDTGIRPELGADGKTILTMMCQRCHNSRLDQTISRARFNIETLDQMSVAEKQLAITRLMLPSTSSTKMPPPRFGVLTQDEIERAIDVLR